MNGAMPEVCAKTIRTPKSNRITIIGVSHHHLFFAKNISSSPTTPIRLTTLSVNRIRSFSLPGTGLSRLLNNAVTQHQTVHTTPRKSTECFGRRVDDWLTFEIERRVQHQRDAGCLSEGLN